MNEVLEAADLTCILQVFQRPGGYLCLFPPQVLQNRRHGGGVTLSSEELDQSSELNKVDLQREARLDLKKIKSRT